MKNNSHTKIFRASSAGLILRVLALAAIMMCGSAVWASETYYLLMSYVNDKNTDLAQVQTPLTRNDHIFSWTVTVPQNNNGNYYFTLSTTSTYSGMYPNVNPYWSCSRAGAPLITSLEGKDYGGYYFYRFSANASSGSVDVTITFNTSEETVTLTTGAAPVVASTYYVLGNGANSDGSASNLKNWSDNLYFIRNVNTKMNQTGSTTYSLTYYNVYNTDGSTYPQFKVNDGGSGWYNTWDDDSSESNGYTIDTGGSDGNIRIQLNKSNKPQNITITYNSAAADNNIHVKIETASLPTVRMGEQPTKVSNSITGTVFLAQTGNTEVSDIKVYYEKGAPNVSTSRFVTLTGPFSCGNLYPYTIDDICDGDDGTPHDWQFMAVATSIVGSANSDVVEYNNFSCCPGGLEDFTLEAASPYVVPGTSYGFFTTVKGGGAEPTYSWRVKVGDGEWQTQVSTMKDMYYLVPSDTEGNTIISIEATVTGSNDCSSDEMTASTTVVACATPTVSISGTSVTEAWTDNALTATVTNADRYKWSVTPDGNYLLEQSESGAVFRAGADKMVLDGTPYTITLTVTEERCGTSVTSDPKVITVMPDKDDC